MNKTKLFKLCKMVMTFKEYETEQGKIIIDGEIAEGVEVSTLDENEEVVPAADGEYVIEDTKITVAEGKISAIEPKEEEKPVEEEEVMEEEKEEETPTESEEAKEDEEQVEESNPELEEAKNRISELEGKLAEAEAKIAELEAELNKPVEEPLQMKSVAKSTVMKQESGALKYFAE